MTTPELIVRAIMVVLVSYLIGSIPTGYLFAKSRGVDIFKVGSGNMGATNVARIGGFGWGVVVWLIDASKGIIAIVLATTVILPQDQVMATMLAAIFAIIGHNWSIFIGLLTGKIRGGKGAATAFGTLIIILPVYVVAGMLLLGGFIIARTRIVSLAVLVMFSMAALAMVVLLGLQLAPWPYTVGSLIIVAIVFYRFRDNIKRLQTGTERRLGDPA